MSRMNTCTPEQKAACPLSKHYSDEHHLAFPSPDYTTKIERTWRNLPINKVQLCRAIHNEIHASGYIPEKPLREDMLTEIWAGQLTTRSVAELNTQLNIGEGRPTEDVV